MSRAGTAMTIGRIEAMRLELPLKKPINLGGRLKIPVAETILVRMETGDGLIGWGECAPAANLTGETGEQIMAAITATLAPALTAQKSNLREFGALLSTAMPGAMGAKSAIDCALHDLFARAQDIPVYELLGGAKRTHLDAMWMVGTPSLDEDAAEAALQRHAGYRVFKLKVGSRSLEDDLRATLAVRDVIGPECTLYADANGTMDEDRAIAYGKRAAALEVAYFEQPLPAKDLDGMARVTAAVPMPVCVDEGIHAVADIAAQAKLKAGRGAALRPVKLGGIAAVHAATEACAAHGWKVNLPGKIAESSLGTAALLHSAAAAATLDWAVTPTNHYLKTELVKAPLAPVDGAFALPSGPGLGIVPDPDAIKEYRPA